VLKAVARDVDERITVGQLGVPQGGKLVNYQAESHKQGRSPS
jgi:hypothetical protein